MNFDLGTQPNNKPGTRNQKSPKSAIHGFICYWGPVLGLCAVIFIQSAFPTVESLPHFPYSDKLMHMAAYGVLSILVCRAANYHATFRYRWRYVFAIGVLGATLYGLSDEWHQSFVPGRSAEAADLLADFIGSVFGSSGYLYGILRLKGSGIKP